MEKLHKRSDGYSETSSGDFAVFPLRKSAVADGINIFEFKPSFTGERIRVEWPIENPIAIFPGDVSMTMVRLGYARNLSDDEVEQYNASVDFDDSNPPPVVDLTKTDEPTGDSDANVPPAEPEDVPADEKPADVQADEKPADADGETEEKKKAGRPKKPVAIPGLTS